MELLRFCLALFLAVNLFTALAFFLIKRNMIFVVLAAVCFMPAARGAIAMVWEDLSRQDATFIFVLSETMREFFLFVLALMLFSVFKNKKSKAECENDNS